MWTPAGSNVTLTSWPAPSPLNGMVGDGPRVERPAEGRSADAGADGASEHPNARKRTEARARASAGDEGRDLLMRSPRVGGWPPKLSARESRGQGVPPFGSGRPSFE